MPRHGGKVFWYESNIGRFAVPALDSRRFGSGNGSASPMGMWAATTTVGALVDIRAFGKATWHANAVYHLLDLQMDADTQAIEQSDD